LTLKTFAAFDGGFHPAPLLTEAKAIAALRLLLPDIVMKMETLLERSRVERIVFYHHPSGKKMEDVEFVEYRDVHVFLGPLGVGVLHDDTLTVYPMERLYEMEASGPAKDYFLEVSRLQMADQDTMLEAMRRAQEPSGP
jgi:hypothetical protein